MYIYEHTHLHTCINTYNLWPNILYITSWSILGGKRDQPCGKSKLCSIVWSNSAQPAHHGWLCSHFHTQTAKGERSASLGSFTQLLQMFMEEYDIPNLSQKLKKKRLVNGILKAKLVAVREQIFFVNWPRTLNWLCNLTSLFYLIAAYQYCTLLHYSQMQTLEIGECIYFAWNLQFYAIWTISNL